MARLVLSCFFKIWYLFLKKSFILFPAYHFVVPFHAYEESSIAYKVFYLYHLGLHAISGLLDWCNCIKHDNMQWCYNLFDYCNWLVPNTYFCWCRRQVFWISKQILQLIMEDAIDDWLLRQIHWLRRDDVIAQGIRWVQDVRIQPIITIINFLEWFLQLTVLDLHLQMMHVMLYMSTAESWLNNYSYTWKKKMLFLWYLYCLPCASFSLLELKLDCPRVCSNMGINDYC